mmetsp:Transcript_13306/g.20796  ORF Transcript_13306/g.20796 Transcript_13306/m.20796 type:complete len:141 (+) Transcript_13306:418-840(+)
MQLFYVGQMFVLQMRNGDKANMISRIQLGRRDNVRCFFLTQYCELHIRPKVVEDEKPVEDIEKSEEGDLLEDEAKQEKRVERKGKQTILLHGGTPSITNVMNSIVLDCEASTSEDDDDSSEDHHPESDDQIPMGEASDKV